MKGELFGVTRGGDVKIGAGQSITLRPLTSYVRNTPKIDFQTQELEPIDKRISAYDRVINTDAQGKFEFDNVPPASTACSVCLAGTRVTCRNWCS